MIERLSDLVNNYFVPRKYFLAHEYFKRIFFNKGCMHRFHAEARASLPHFERKKT
jgi:hypothetical protein